MKHALILVFLGVVPFILFGALSEDIRNRNPGGVPLRLNPNAATNRVNRPSMPPMPPRTLEMDRLQPAIEVTVKEAVTRAISRNPQTSQMIGDHYQQVGRVFTQMETNSNFTAEFVEKEIRGLLFPPELPQPYVEKVDALIISLYYLAYEGRTSAELPTTEWLLKVTRMFKTAISSGLKATGHVGLEDTQGVTR